MPFCWNIWFAIQAGRSWIDWHSLKGIGMSNKLPNRRYRLFKAGPHLEQAIGLMIFVSDFKKIWKVSKFRYADEGRISTNHQTVEYLNGGSDIACIDTNNYSNYDGSNDDDSIIPIMKIVKIITIRMMTKLKTQAITYWYSVTNRNRYRVCKRYMPSYLNRLVIHFALMMLVTRSPDNYTCRSMW